MCKLTKEIQQQLLTLSTLITPTLIAPEVLTPYRASVKRSDKVIDIATGSNYLHILSINEKRQ